MHTDKYRSFADLRVNEREGIDYRIVQQRGASRFAIIAPHGGLIETGTSEIARAVAAGEHTFYSFEGVKPAGAFKDLHITSINFDEPVCLKTVGRVATVVAIHGCTGAVPAVHLGGLDDVLKQRIRSALELAGFTVGNDQRFPATDPRNICNRSLSGKGVQLELTKGLRRMFRQTDDESQRTTIVFHEFVTMLRSVLS